MKNKIFGLFVSFLLIEFFFFVAVNNVSADQKGDYSCIVINGKATITKYNGAGGAVTIPSMLDGYPTVAISDHAFYQCYSLTSLVIPNSVSTIGKNAFDSCLNLTTVTLPNNINFIGEEAFSYCDSLISIDIPRNVTTIENSTFDSCYSLDSVTIPDNVYTIGEGAFENCHSLSSIDIPYSVTNIDDSAFDSCSSLVSIIIPTSVTSIQWGAFLDCSSLTSVTIGNSADTSIEDFAFADCPSLTSITFLGLDSPHVQPNWIKNTPEELRGHSYVNSNFPGEGFIWNGLTIGTAISGNESLENEPPIADFNWMPADSKINQTITFDASASTDPEGFISIFEWDWNNDSIYEESRNSQIATHSWLQPDTYFVTLRVIDNNNLTNTKTIAITVENINQTPTSSIPGFELFLILLSIVFVLLLNRKRKNNI